MMAQIWSELRSSDVGEGEARWGVVSLDASCDALSLTGDPARPVARLIGERAAGGAYILRHDGTGGAVKWMLYAGPEARVAVNGLSLSLGMRQLRDRDEISLPDGCHLIFTVDSTPQVTAFDAVDGEVVCPRCAGPIKSQQLAVRCPRCGVWHHEDESAERSCWTYGPTCMACGKQATALDGEPAWTPEGL